MHPKYNSTLIELISIPIEKCIVAQYWHTNAHTTTTTALDTRHEQATAAMGTYLEDYLESMYMLPSEIKRNFDLMRELDKVHMHSRSLALLFEAGHAAAATTHSSRRHVFAPCV